MTPQQERAANGAGLLDQLMPGWAKLIDAQGLDMGRTSYCVLGQLELVRNPGAFTPFLDMLNDQGLDNGVPEGFSLNLAHWASNDPAINHGFSGNLAEFKALTEAWRALIASRV